MNNKAKHKRRKKLTPQHYEHRVAVVLYSLEAAISAAELLVSFLLEQQGVNWTEQAAKAKLAKRSFQRACTWLDGINRH